MGDDVASKRRVRAFIAVRLDPAVEARIAQLVEELRALKSRVRWVAPDNFHVTLHFLGNAVDLDAIRTLLVPALATIATRTRPFEVLARGTGTFPNSDRPRIIWVGLQSDALISLAQETRAAVERLGFEPEARPFSAHLTLGRIRSPQGFAPTARALERARERDFGLSTVARMTVYQSILAPEGPNYRPLHELDLGQPAS